MRPSLAPFLRDHNILSVEDLQRCHVLSGYEIIELQERATVFGAWCAFGMLVIGSGCVVLLLWMWGG